METLFSLSDLSVPSPSPSLPAQSTHTQGASGRVSRALVPSGPALGLHLKLQWPAASTPDLPGQTGGTQERTGSWAWRCGPRYGASASWHSCAFISTHWHPINSILTVKVPSAKPSKLSPSSTTPHPPRPAMLAFSS
jgi:hypothetical protein